MGIDVRYATARDNVVYGTYYDGIDAEGSLAQGNRVYNNSHSGIAFRYGSTIQDNVVSSNSTGIWGYSAAQRGTAVQNVIDANTNTGVLLDGASADLINNTLYQPVGDAIRAINRASLRVRNSILWVDAGYLFNISSDSQSGFASDYNLLYHGDGFCAPIDLLLVINFLNSQEGEGEADKAIVSYSDSLASEMFQGLTRPAAFPSAPLAIAPRSFRPAANDSRQTATAARTGSRRPLRQAEKTRDLESEVDAILEEIADDVARARLA